MALKRSKLQQIPQRNKDLAFGYVKQNENANKSTIPDMIKYLCLIYLNQNKDEFDAENTNGNIKINGNTVIGSGWNAMCTYLRNIVSDGVHVWRFKFGFETNYYVGDMIGIISNDEELTLYSYFNGSGSGSDAYGFAVAGRLTNRQGKEYGRKCKINDIIEMQVDFNELTLSYKINQTDYGKAFDIKPGEYRAAITLYLFSGSEKNCYTLMSYQHIY